MSATLTGLSTAALLSQARAARDEAAARRITFSPKVFIPLTKLCRDRCGYCTFAQPPARVTSPFMELADVLVVARRGAAAGCHEALFTLGEAPEERYPAAREWLDDHGYASTTDYLVAACRAVLDETGLLPHANPGALPRDELARLREVAPSQGMMVETLRADLLAHRGAPDKLPERRLATLDWAGELRIPYTTGILCGIGETEADRVEALEAIAASHARHGHVQEVIVQNFLPKPGTAMRDHPPCPPEDHLRAIALARLLLPADVARPGPAQPGRRRGPAARGGRVGPRRRVAGDHRPREPRAALAPPRRPGRGHRRGRVPAGPPPHRAPPLRRRRRHLDRSRPAHRGHGPGRRRGPRARRPGRRLPQQGGRGPQRRRRRRGRPGGPAVDGLVLRRRRGADRAGAGPLLSRRAARWARCSRASGPARSWATTRSSPCSPPAAGRSPPSPSWPTSCAAGPSATWSPTSATATSTTPTSAPSSAGSAASPRVPCRSTSGARPTC